jgi:hypothetical protein
VSNEATGDGATFSTRDAAWLRPSRLLIAAALGLPASPLLFAIAVAAKAGVLGAVSMVAFFVGILGAIYAYQSNPWSSRRTGSLTAGNAGVALDGETIIRSRAITAGFVVPRFAQKPVVRLERRWLPPVELEVEDEDRGRALLLALGLDASQRVAKFNVSAPQGASMWLFAGLLAFAIVLGVGGAAAHLSGSAFGALLRLGVIVPAVVFALGARGRISVGADGLFITELGSKRFIGYGEIERVEHLTEKPSFSRYHYYCVQLTKTNGDVVKIRVNSTQGVGSETRVNAIVERIRESMATFAHGGAEASALLLRRGTRDVADWIRSLRAAGTGANQDHRTAPVSLDKLWRIVEDPGAEADARAGAAVALGTSLDERGRVRLLAAAEATASPKVRVALQAASATSDDELAEALAALAEGGGDGPMTGARLL